MLDEPIEIFHVNSDEVSEVEYENAPYQYLNIIENKSLVRWQRPGEFVGVHLLVADIEEKLAAVGLMTLGEEDEILRAKRTWVEFFTSEQWRELPIFPGG